MLHRPNRQLGETGVRSHVAVAAYTVLIGGLVTIPLALHGFVDAE
ncbi:MAG: hypothetical protein AVDCRST_MAG01-01-3934 [uncultured Rubrobacteraceae bacterium]|uniref:Uncharacterized protein n=1 Tax=uncultured Rubrobacteraceae bacterium TaxID=349277 RepID=A0A6J4QIB0_9ACTN|nr:MAG: hypothetical protein AVDCRST_MAG01-01-3934 [uncultured Rubrobacteraceae bacterium]